MKTYKKPPNYAQIQKTYNSVHTDGSLENEGDSVGIYDVLGHRIHLKLSHPKTILVLGCRTGYECQASRRYFLSDPLVIGVDVVPEFVKHSCKRVPTMVGDMHDLELPDDFFDLVICRGTLEHCYNPKLAVEEIYRVCKNIAYITVDLEMDRKAFRSHFAFSDDPTEWLEMFEEVGFQILEKGFDKGMFHEGLWAILRKQHG